MAQQDVFVGIDVAKAMLDVAVLPGGETFRSRTTPPAGRTWRAPAQCRAGGDRP
jgi:hypothetical protein